MTTREELNKAIFKVLTTQFKKEMKEAVNTVEEAGYEIYKYNGHFNVRNPKTDKVIYASGNYNLYIATNGNAKRKVIDWKIDFVGMLEKPINKEWNERNWMRGIGSTDYKAKRRRLTDAKSSIEWKKRDIERKQAQILKLQEELLRDLKYQAQYEADLANVRKELGLTRR